MNSKKIIQIVIMLICFAIAGSILWKNFGSKPDSSQEGSRSQQSAAERAAERESRRKQRAAEEEARKAAALAEELADPNYVSDDGWPAIVEASYRGDSERVAQLLQDGADINVKGPGGWTALMQAAGNGHQDVIGQLIDAGAFLFAEHEMQHTAYQIAEQRKHKEIVNQLASVGADIDARPLCDLIHANKSSRARRLIEGGAPVNAVDPDGRTPIFYTICKRRSRYSNPVQNIDPKFFHWLLEQGATLDHKDQNGHTLLLAYVSQFDASPDMVRQLITAGAEPDVQDPQKRSSIHLAGSPEVAEVLHEAGVPLGKVDEHGNTPLHHHIHQLHSLHVQWLIENGASLTSKNNEGKTPSEMLPAEPRMAGQKKHWTAIQTALTNVADDN